MATVFAEHPDEQVADALLSALVRAGASWHVIATTAVALFRLITAGRAHPEMEEKLNVIGQELVDRERYSVVAEQPFVGFEVHLLLLLRIAG